MQQQSFEDLKNFMSRFLYWEQLGSQTYIDRLRIFVALFADKESVLNELARTSTPHYNLFEILKIGHLETKVHTPFLAHLLDPNGNHSQGRLFFDSFCKSILKIKEQPADISRIRVMQEQRNELGQIDIQIWYEHNRQQKAVVVENKIYHHDGKAQLSRYYQYMKRQKIEDCNLQLLYLTPRGGPPEQQSLGNTPQECLITASYYEDISAWLLDCMKEIDQNALHHTIHQYLKTIRTI